MAKRTDKQHEDRLNHIYFDNMFPDDVFESLVYLTNKDRKDHITERKLWDWINRGKVGSLLRKYDPIAFHTSKEDY